MKRFRKILLVDPPRRGRKTALKRAVELARRNGAELTVIGVVEPVSGLVERLAGENGGTSLTELLVNERRARIGRAVKPHRMQGFDVAIRIVTGSGPYEIIQEVLAEGHDLVMLTAAGGRRSWLGSTATHLMRKCPVPVWVMKPIPRPGYRSVLAAVDVEPGDTTRSELAQRVLELGSSLARTHGADLHLVTSYTVVGEAVLKNRMRMGPEQLDRIARKTKAAKERELRTLLGDIHTVGLNTTIHLPRGPAVETIPEIAKRSDSDVIVMGTVGRTGLAGVLVGNTAEEIQSRVRSAILAVKPDGFVSPITPREEPLAARER